MLQNYKFVSKNKLKQKQYQLYLKRVNVNVSKKIYRL